MDKYLVSYIVLTEFAIHSQNYFITVGRNENWFSAISRCLLRISLTSKVAAPIAEL